MIFGTDGIRGLAGEKLDTFCAMKVALAIGTYFKKSARTNRVIVGKDTRRSGYMIEAAVVSALTSVGFDVLQIGPMPTPAVAFLSEDMLCDFAIMISASHNPYYDNGIKVFNSQGAKLSLDDEREIDAIYQSESFIKATHEHIGKAKRIDDVLGRYIVHIKNSFNKARLLAPLRIALDCANGAAYKVAPAVFSELGAEIITIADTPDGVNINDDCGALHPRRLCELVRHTRADVGFAFDGDADRLVVVNELGEVINGDVLLGVLAAALQNAGKLKGGVALSKMSNGALIDFLRAKNIPVSLTDVGDKYILAAMSEHGYNFGGEQSGHIIFSDYSKSGDGIVAALQVAKLLQNAKASEIFSAIKLFPQELINIKTSAKPPLEELAGYAELCAQLEAACVRALIRYSGTENLLRIQLEAASASELAKYAKICKEFFSKALG